MKERIRSLLRRLDIDVGRAYGRPPGVMDFLMDRRIGLVLDVGAKEGQFARWLRAHGYRGRIRSFEPVPAMAARLVRAARDDPDWQVEPFALGADSRTAAIHVAGDPVFGSLLPVAAAAWSDAAAATHRTEEIEVRMLDEVLPAVPERTFLRIGTQGFERQVLEGARRALPRIEGVLMELPVVHPYEGTWRLHEALAFMERLGFVPAQLHPVNFHPRDRVSLVEVDSLFRRHDPVLDAAP